jgi:acetylglutamate kinase
VEVQEALQKAGVLVEALPWLSRFRGKTFVIKYGGAAMKDAALRESFARDVALLEHVGINPVVVHGGGPQIDRLLEKLAIPTRKVAGMRVTDEPTMEVVEMVLAGKINQEIVSGICTAGGRAVGLSGHDARFLKAKRIAGDKGEDLGLVGEVTEVDAAVVERLEAGEFIPVIAPIGVDAEGRSLNINADYVAGSVAAALRAEKLILLTDVEGVLDGAGKMIRQLDSGSAGRAMADGTLQGGMIPKVKCCLGAIEKGVRSAHIVDGRVPHAVLLEIFTDRGIGTVIREKA